MRKIRRCGSKTVVQLALKPRHSGESIVSNVFVFPPCAHHGLMMMLPSLTKYHRSDYANSTHRRIIKHAFKIHPHSCRIRRSAAALGPTCLADRRYLEPDLGQNLYKMSIHALRLPLFRKPLPMGEPQSRSTTHYIHSSWPPIHALPIILVCLVGQTTSADTGRSVPVQSARWCTPCRHLRYDRCTVSRRGQYPHLASAVHLLGRPHAYRAEVAVVVVRDEPPHLDHA